MKERSTQNAPGAQRIQLTSRSKIEADQRVAVAGVAVADVQKSIRERGIRTHRRRQDLRPRERLERLRRRRSEHELASFAHDQKFVAGQRDRAGPETVLAPADLARVQVDSTKARIVLLTTVKAVQSCRRRTRSSRSDSTAPRRTTRAPSTRSPARARPPRRSRRSPTRRSDRRR